MVDSKRSKLSLPTKTAGPRGTTERTRAPLRGSDKPRAPRTPAAAKEDRNERARNAERRRGLEEKPSSFPRGENRPPRGDRTPRPYSDRAAGDHPAFNDRRPYEDRPTSGERPRYEGDRPARPAFRDGDRPRPGGDRPTFGDRPRREGDRPTRPSTHAGDRPRRDDDRPSNPYEGRSPSGDRPRTPDERPAYADRPRRDNDRPQRPREERPSFGDRPRYQGDHPARPTSRDGDRPRTSGERPAYADRPRHDNDRPRSGGDRPTFGDRPRREEDRPARPAFRDGDRPRPSGERPAYADRPRRNDDRPFRPSEDHPRNHGDRPARPTFRDGDRLQPAEDRLNFADRPHRNNEPTHRHEEDSPRSTPIFEGRSTDNVPQGKSFNRSRVASAPEQTGQTQQEPASAFANPASPRHDADSDEPGSVRLSKRMSELGLCSRREADDYIERGWVKVDGEVISELGSKVLPDQQIELAPVAEEIQLRRVTILINKPIGFVSGQAEDGYEPAAVLVTPENHWEEDPTRRRFESRIVRKLAPAGRLDIDSTGLLVLTQDGRIAKQLIGETSDIEKEYLVRVEGDLSAEGMRLLHHGLELDGVELEPAKVSWQNEDQLRFVLHEGRKRQIRRMCEMVGLRVVGLKRVRIGRIPLGKLPVGQWRYLGEHEAF
jgi:23S rRNA pseudouridine2604 synthase